MTEAMRHDSNQTAENVKISKEEMTAICRRFHIPPYHMQCFLRLANQGQIKSREFGRRLCECGNYKRAYNALMEFLSRPIAHLFAYPTPRMVRRAKGK